MNPAANRMRFDLEIIASWIEPGSRVIDLGCGEGDLLQHLITRQGGARPRHRAQRGEGRPLHRARAFGAAGGHQRGGPRLPRGRVRLRHPEPDPAAGLRAGRAHPRHAAHRPPGHRELPQLQPLGHPAPGLLHRLRARVAATPLPVVRHAQHPGDHPEGLPQVHRRGGAAHPARGCDQHPLAGPARHASCGCCRTSGPPTGSSSSERSGHEKGLVHENRFHRREPEKGHAEDPGRRGVHLAGPRPGGRRPRRALAPPGQPAGGRKHRGRRAPRASRSGSATSPRTSRPSGSTGKPCRSARAPAWAPRSSWKSPRSARSATPAAPSSTTRATASCRGKGCLRGCIHAGTVTARRPCGDSAPEKKGFKGAEDRGPPRIRRFDGPVIADSSDRSLLTPPEPFWSEPPRCLASLRSHPIEYH